MGTVGEGETDGLEWTLEAVHFPDPVTRWSSALYTTMQTEVVARLMAEIGVLLDGVAFRSSTAGSTRAVVPLGGRARSPPRWLVPIIGRTCARRCAGDWPRPTPPTSPTGRPGVEEWKSDAEDDLLERGHGLPRR